MNLGVLFQLGPFFGIYLLGVFANLQNDHYLMILDDYPGLVVNLTSVI